MKIYVSEKENIDLSKNCFLTFSTKDKETVDWNVLAQSLEQHEAEIRKPLKDEIVELKEHVVIAELEEWCDINEQFGVHNEKFIKDLRQKLNEMKGE